MKQGNWGIMPAVPSLRCRSGSSSRRVLLADYDFEAHKELVPMQPGDVPTTYADASALERDFGFTPRVTLREGLRKFAEWYKEYYG